MYKQKNKIILSIILAAFLLVNGCASTNTGPPLSKDELRKLEEEIEMLATEIFINDSVMVWKVGFDVLSIMPEGVFKNRAVIGALIEDNTEDIAGFYKLPTEEGCVVIGAGVRGADYRDGRCGGVYCEVDYLGAVHVAGGVVGVDADVVLPLAEVVGVGVVVSVRV